MRSVPVLVALALGAVVLASGCGQQHAGTPAGPPLSASASAAPVPSPVPGDPGDRQVRQRRPADRSDHHYLRR